MEAITRCKDWLKEDRHNMRFTIHVCCMLVASVFAFWATRSLLISGGQFAPMFIQESVDLVGKLE